jgi:hypothetical protein
MRRRLELMDDAVGATSHEEFSARTGEVVMLTEDLSIVVVHLVAALLKENGVHATVETVQVPAVFRAARDWAENGLKAAGKTGSDSAAEPGS